MYTNTHLQTHTYTYYTLNNKKIQKLKKTDQRENKNAHTHTDAYTRKI